MVVAEWLVAHQLSDAATLGPHAAKCSTLAAPLTASELLLPPPRTAPVPPAGLLLNNLSVYHGCDIVFDSMDVPELAMDAAEQQDPLAMVTCLPGLAG